MFNATCVQERQWQNLVMLPFVFLCALLNLVVFAATIVNRKRLQRQNYMFMCVDSTLLSNVLFLAIEIWILMDQYVGTFEHFGSAKKIIWSVCQTAVVSMMFVMCGNIGALLFVVLDSTYFVGRSVNRRATNQFVNDSADDRGSRSKRWAYSAKRRRAVILVVLSWILPLILAIVAVFKLSCHDICILCLGGRVVGRPCPVGRGCSQVWPPIQHAYLGISAGTWFLEVIGLLFIIYSAVRAFNEVMAPPPTPRADLQSLEPVVETVETVKSSSSESPDIPPSDQNSSNPRVTINEEASTTKSRGGRKRPEFRFHSRIRFMIVITGTFVVCTLPTIITFLIDIANYQIDFEPALYISFVFLYIYTVLCPILLVKYLPNLRSSLIVMLRRCSCSPISKHKTRSIHRQNSHLPSSLNGKK